MIKCSKRLKNSTANPVPHNSVNEFSFLLTFSQRLFSNSAIHPFPFPKFEKTSLCFSAVRSERFLAPQLGRREVAGMDRNKSFESRVASLVNHLGRLCCMPIVSRGILAGKFFAYS